MSPIQTLTATSTAPTGSTLVWYDAATGGSVVASPTLNSIGTVTYYSESVNSATNCSSSTRTPVILTISKAPIAGTVTGNQEICTALTTSFKTDSLESGVWSSSDVLIATVDSSTGVVTGVGAGTATITYTVVGTGGCLDAKATRTVTVTAAPVVGTLSGTQAICVGLTTTFSSTTLGGTWSSSDVSVATIDSSTGLITGVGAGVATMTYNVTGTGGCSDVSDIRTVTVTAAPNAGTLDGVQNICAALTTTFTTDSLESGVWSSSDALIATVDSSTGVVTGVGAGTATITYTVAGTGGCFDAKATRTVTVTAAPVAGTLSGTQAICEGLTTTFSSTTLGGTWSSSDVSVATIDSSTGLVTGVGAGTASMVYTVEGNGGCSNVSDALAITVNANDTPLFTSVPPVCYGATISVLPTTSDNGITGTWSPTLNNTKTTTYKFTPTLGLCAVPTTLEIVVLPLPIITATPSLKEICSNTSPNIELKSDISGTTFDWTVVQTNITGATNSSGDSINQTLSAVSNDKGEALYTITPTANGCQGASITAKIIVNPIPTVSTTGNEPICSGNTTNISLTGTVIGTTFSWNAVSNKVLGAFSSTGSKIVQTLKTATNVQGSVDYSIVPLSNGCIGSPTLITVVVNPVPEVFGSSKTTICSGDSTNIILSPSIVGTQFDWTVSQDGVTGASLGTGDLIQQTLVAGKTLGSATYTITPTVGGCSGTSIKIKINVNPSPMPEIEDGIICVTSDTGETLKSYLLDTQLSNSTYDFKWYFDDEEIVGASQNKYEATDTGVYSVIVTNTITSCVSDEKKVTVIPNYPADSFTVAVSDAFTQNATITVTVQGGTGPYFYQLDNGLAQASTVFTNVSSGEHTITVTDEQGCTSESQKITIIDYPKYFTPNGDGYNDKWNIGGLTNTNIDIYDRYGKLIKQINTSSLGWDGTYNGQLLPATDYWFTIEYIEPNTNNTKIFKSHFSLKR
ncbi:MAG: T9SS type B sorting domain-containing protein [Flavobacterium sp.]|nr:T9SS type B sorting domain-containing protein [Flavobacterium sp.]